MLSEPGRGPLTLTTLAAEGNVSRRTLYTHWGSIEKVISDAVTIEHSNESPSLEGLPARERLSLYLKGVRDAIGDPVTTAALATLMNEALHDDVSAQALGDMGKTRIGQFHEMVGPITLGQFAQLVGPIFISQFMIRTPVSDDLIAELVERGMDLLDLSDSIVDDSERDTATALEEAS